MVNKFLVTNYDREDIVSMIKEAFHEELKEILIQNEKESDYSALLSRKDVAVLLKISLATVSKFQREGKLPFSRFGSHIYFKKGDVMKALETPIKYQRRKW